MIEGRRDEPPERPDWPAVAIGVAVCAIAYYLIDHGFAVSSYLETPQEQTVELDDLVAEGNAGRRIGFLMLATLGTAGCVFPARRAFRWTPAIAVLFAFHVGWCYASVVWADDRPLTIRRFGVLTFLVLAAVGIARRLSAREVCWLVMGVGLAHWAIGLFAECALGTFRPWGAEYRFAGTIHPNNQGVQLAGVALAACCLAKSVRRGRLALIAIAAVAALFLWLTKSRTSCAGLALGVLIIWLPSASQAWKAVAFVFAPTAAVALLLLAYLLNWNAADRIASVALMGRGEEAETLTGRVPLWREVLTYIEERPWLGYGYGGFWNVPRMRRISENQGWQIAHSHSAYLETVLNVGVIGAVVLFGAILLTFVTATRAHVRSGDPGFRFISGFTAFAALYSTTDAVFAQPGFASLVQFATVVLAASTGPTSRSAPSVQRALPAYSVEEAGRRVSPEGNRMNRRESAPHI